MFEIEPKWEKCPTCGQLHVDWMGCSECAGDTSDDMAQDFILSLVFVLGVLALVIWMATA